MENIDWTYLLFKFDGRINRAKFWAGMVAAWLILLVGGMIVGLSLMIDSGGFYFIAGILFIAMYVAAVWMGLAIHIKRWHDRGKSGWWVLIALIPIIGQIWALVETGFLIGTPGPNEYGPDPLLEV